jgi:hypothetical protein
MVAYAEGAMILYSYAQKDYSVESSLSCQDEKRTQTFGVAQYASHFSGDDDLLGYSVGERFGRITAGACSSGSYVIFILPPPVIVVL